MSGDAVSFVLLVLIRQVLKHHLGELAQVVLLQLHILPLPLLVILSQILAMTQFIGPVGLSSADID